MNAEQMQKLAARLRAAAHANRLRSSEADFVAWANDLDAAADLIEKMAQAEPVAVRHNFDGHGWLYLDNGSGSDWLTRHADAEPLYLALAQYGIKEQSDE